MYSKVFLVLAVAAFANANDIHEGHNDTESLKPVFQGRFTAEWAFARPTKEVFVNVSGLITAINVTDLRDGKDGVASIVSGGIGHENVTISLKSPVVLRGYDFLVEIYADEEEIERGSRGLPDMPIEHPIAPENNTTQPESVSTSTTGKPTDVSSVPTVTAKSGTTSKPGVTGILNAGYSLKSVTDAETRHPTGKHAPKLEMDIQNESEVPMYGAYYRTSTEKHI